MGKILRAGKVVVVLRGRFAGRKAVVVKTSDGHDHGKRPYGHAIVAGIDRYPLKVTKSMGKKKVVKRSKIKPFVKTINFNHVLPTRYNLEIDVKSLHVGSDVPKEKRPNLKKTVRRLFQERYLAGKNRWFFSKLRF